MGREGGHNVGEPLRLADELVRAMGENVEDSSLVLAQEEAGEYCHRFLK